MALTQGNISGPVDFSGLVYNHHSVTNPLLSTWPRPIMAAVNRNWIASVGVATTTQPWRKAVWALQLLDPPTSNLADGICPSKSYPVVLLLECFLNIRALIKHVST